MDGRLKERKRRMDGCTKEARSQGRKEGRREG